MPSTSPPPQGPATPAVIDWAGCTGTLRDGEQSLDVVCDVSVARDGTVALRFEELPMSKEAARFQHTSVNDRGATMRHYRLELLADNGDRLSTDNAILTSVGGSMTPERSVIRFSGEALTLSVAHPPTPEWESAGTTRLARYHLIGLHGFRDHTETLDDERVVLVGACDVQDYDELAGELVVESNASTGDDNGAWLEATDGRVRGILLMVSLGAGRFVPWSIREFAVGGIGRSLEFMGCRRSGRPFDPLFHRLNLGPALRLGTHHYSRELGERTGLDAAVEWYVMDHAYSEARYLASMTALEHLVSKHDGAVLPIVIFRRAREMMEAALDANDTVDAVAAVLRTSETGMVPDEATALAAAQAALAQVRSRLGNLNRLSLFDSVGRLLALYRVPHEDIVPDVRRLIAVRNDIVHRGLHNAAGADEPLPLLVAALRELLRRIFLAILGYEGNYESHYPLYQTRHFCQVVPAATPPVPGAPSDDPPPR